MGNMRRSCRSSSNELEDKIITLYAKGLSVRDIHDSLQEMYGIDVSAATISAITQKVWPLVETWQNRRLDAVYPLIFLDAIHVHLRREGRVHRHLHRIGCRFGWPKRCIGTWGR